MNQSTIRQSIARLVAIVALATGLLLSNGIAAAAEREVGLTACDGDACAVVTVEGLKALRAERGLMVYQPVQFPTDRFSPHFIP